MRAPRTAQDVVVPRASALLIDEHEAGDEGEKNDRIDKRKKNEQCVNCAQICATFNECAPEGRCTRTKKACAPFLKYSPCCTRVRVCVPRNWSFTPTARTVAHA